MLNRLILIHTQYTRSRCLCKCITYPRGTCWKKASRNPATTCSRFVRASQLRIRTSVPLLPFLSRRRRRRRRGGRLRGERANRIAPLLRRHAALVTATQRWTLGHLDVACCTRRPRRRRFRRSCADWSSTDGRTVSGLASSADVRRSSAARVVSRLGPPARPSFYRSTGNLLSAWCCLRPARSGGTGVSSRTSKHRSELR